LVPKPPAKNVMKMLQNEKKRLRFRARFADPKDAADEQRRFIITYFTADDTIAVYEERCAHMPSTCLRDIARPDLSDSSRVHFQNAASLS
jgi:nitrite reductase/ring-hydroxylating ferredoxin subunit